ncbi:MAG: SagB/ThcOx family dehydrogenase [Candidatus Velthaea sp.]
MDPYRNGSATLNAAWVVYGTPGEVSPDDPAESYHEASALYATQLARQLPGIAFLESNPQLQLTASRSTKRHPHVPAIALPPCTLPDVSLGDVLARRRTRPHFGTAGPSFEKLALVLRAAYGVTGSAKLPGGGDQSFRAAPSAGALYPLEFYALVFACDGLSAGIYHYDPLRDVLERLAEGDRRAAFAPTLPMRELGERCAVALVVSAMFWRTRFKYGQRGYRFALLEAGHAAQNALLAAEALGLATVPVGGFFDRQLSELLDIDGVNEAPLYVLSIGTRP